MLRVRVEEQCRPGRGWGRAARDVLAAGHDCTVHHTTPSTELQISIFGYQGGEGLVSIHGHVFRHLNRAS